MSRTKFRSIVLAVVSATAVAGPFAGARAQHGKDVARDPGDPKAAVPAARYESAFARYRPNAEVEVGAWRDANDNVGRIGGWRKYGREAIADSQSESPASTAGRVEGDAGPEPGQRPPQRGPQ